MASWSSIDCAIASASSTLLNDCPAISSESPLNLLATVERSIPALVSWFGVLLVLVTSFFDSLSKPRTLTFSTCCTDVMRGRKLWRSSG